jgi:NAD(P) transhydrogenase subunit alpha
MRVVVLKERAEYEQRVALIPESVSKLTKAGAEVVIEQSAGALAGFPDAQYTAAGASVAPSRGQALAAADVVLGVQPPVAVLNELPPAAVVISMVPAATAAEVTAQFAARGVTALALDKVPRITRAQSMDILSSQATVAGYKAVVLGAAHMPRLMPMLRPVRWPRRRCSSLAPASPGCRPSPPRAASVGSFPRSTYGQR